MQGIYDFIVHIEEAFNNTITHGSLELFVDHNLDRTEHSNRIAKVISTPKSMVTDIAVGDDVLIIQTIVMPHITAKGREQSPYLVDRDKKYYRVPDSMVVMYRKPGLDWKCHGNNVLVMPIEEEREKEVNGIIQVRVGKSYSNEAYIAYSNPTLTAQGVGEMDRVIVQSGLDHEYKLDGTTYWRMQGHHILAKIIDDADLAHNARKRH